MMDRIEVEGVYTDKMSSGLESSAKSVSDLTSTMTALSSKGSSAAKGVASAFKKMDGVAGAVTDEIRSRVDNAISTMVEFGAGAEQVEQGFALLAAAGDTGARGIAQQSNALRTLVDETEDADVALANVSKALDLAAATGLKAEDAGRELGKTLKGETGTLRKFDERARQAADAIDKIQDPALRAKMATRELERALKRQNSVLTKARDQVRAFTASQPGMVKALKASALAGVAAGAAIGAGMAKAVKSYLEGSASMRKATTKAKKAFGDLAFQIGGIITRSLGLDKALENSAEIIAKIGDFIERHRVAIARVITFVAKGAVHLASLVANIGLGIAMFATFIVEGIQELVRKGFGVVGDVMESIADAIGSINRVASARGFGELIDPAVAQNLQDTAKAFQKVGEAPVSLPLTEALVDLQDKANAARDSVLEALSAEPDAARLSRKGRRGLGRRTKPGAGGSSNAKRNADDLGQSVGASIVATAQESSKQLDATAEKILVIVRATEDLGEAVRGTGELMDSFATQSMSTMIQSLDGFIFALAKGGDSMKGFGQGLVIAFADLTSQVGQGLVLLSLGVGKIQTGDFSGALGIGLGLIAFGAALKGFASRTTGTNATTGSDGSTARALERFGRRLFERDDPAAGRELVVNIDGRQMRAFMTDTIDNAVRARQIPALRRLT
jgi:hypothetical protein